MTAFDVVFVVVLDVEGVASGGCVGMSSVKTEYGVTGTLMVLLANISLSLCMWLILLSSDI